MSNTTVTAINKKHQAAVNRYIKAITKYNSIVDAMDSEDDHRSFARLERAEERAYDKAYDIWCELPKRERMNITKTDSLLAA